MAWIGGGWVRNVKQTVIKRGHNQRSTSCKCGYKSRQSLNNGFEISREPGKGQVYIC